MSDVDPSTKGSVGRNCSHPGCNRKAAAGVSRCAKHPAKPRRNYKRRKNSTQRGYTSSRWKQLREMILMRDPLCVDCQALPSSHVDHVVPRRLGGTDHPTNLQGMCASCHARKTIHGR